MGLAPRRILLGWHASPNRGPRPRDAPFIPPGSFPTITCNLTGSPLPPSPLSPPLPCSFPVTPDAGGRGCREGPRMGGPTRSPAPRTAPPALPPFDPLLPPPRARGAGWGDVGGGAREVSVVGVVVVVVVGMVVGGRALVGQKREGRGPADRRRQRSPAAGSRLLRAARPALPPPGPCPCFPPVSPPPRLLLLLLVFPNPAHPARPGPARPGHRRPPTHLGIPSPGPPFPGGRYLQRPVRRAAPRR